MCVFLLLFFACLSYWFTVFWEGVFVPSAFFLYCSWVAMRKQQRDKTRMGAVTFCKHICVFDSERECVNGGSIHPAESMSTLMWTRLNHVSIFIFFFFLSFRPQWWCFHLREKILWKFEDAQVLNKHFFYWSGSWIESFLQHDINNRYFIMMLPCSLSAVPAL